MADKPQDLLADGGLTISGAKQFSGMGHTPLYAAMERDGLAYIKVGRTNPSPGADRMAIRARGDP